MTAVARRLAANGIVLLENRDGALPLSAGEEIVLLGVTSYCNIRMGWGSGDMLNHPAVQYDRGLENAGIRLDDGFARYYRDFIADPARRKTYARVNRDWGRWTHRFCEPNLSDRAFALLSEGKRARKCLVTIGRGAGESEDLQDAPGGFRLHEQEEQLLKEACAAFDTVIVLLNGPGVLDTSFMERYPVKALVFTSYLGEVAGDAVADILTGRVCPSGKTVDTWAKRYCDYPTVEDFGARTIPYREDDFGYSAFLSKPESVRYPFGYGLSYTSFELQCESVRRDEGKVSFMIRVSNTGTVVGAEIVQLYVDLPVRVLKSRRAARRRRLCAFSRVSLGPGQTDSVELVVDLNDLADYVETNAAWVLRAGEYRFFCGNSSVRVRDVLTYTIAEDRIVQKVRNRFNGQDNMIARRELVKGAKGFVSLQDVLAKRATLEDLVAQFSDEELVATINGRILRDWRFAFLFCMGAGGSKRGRVDGEAGEFWSCEKYGIPAVVCADGPSGVRLCNFNEPVSKYNPVGAKMVAWPCATALAQGWDLAAAETFGRRMTEDLRLAGVDCWLAPGVNLHRNPLCGRNFEYFSEDPYLSGMMGASVVRGVQRRTDGTPSGRIATIKHFCVNNQESHRRRANAVVDETTLREIYLKPFEIAVKRGKPVAVMSSYNQLNGDYCATTYDLLTGVLREEWGFDGVVMTDWWNSADKASHPAAGNDVVMPGTRKSHKAMLSALKAGRMRRADAQQAAVNVLKAAVFKLSK